jgi:F0F1-type ATP synthase membrane subunit c/vacuolar-type H+-ATPase subunit K
MAFYLLGLPAIGVLVAFFAAMSSLRDARESVPNPQDVRATDIRVVVLLTMLATPLLFGFVSFQLYVGIDGSSLPAGLALAAAQSLGIPALLLGIGYAIIFQKGVKAIVLRPDTFIRTLLMATNLEVVVIFALVVNFTMFNSVSLPLPLDFIERARTSSLYMMAGGVAAPTGALVVHRMWDFESMDRWLRAFIYETLAVSYVVVFFTLSLLSLGGII